MTDFSFTLRIFSLIGIIFFLSACNASPTEQTVVDFEKLCVIYKENGKGYNVKNIPSTKMFALATRIEKEVPNLSDVFQNVIVSAPPEEVYSLVQQVAEIKTKNKWDCPAMESFYSSNK